MNIQETKNFKAEYQQVLSQKDKVIEVSKKLSQHSKRIYFIGSGGAYTKYFALKDVFDVHYPYPTGIYYPKEFELLYLDRLTSDDLIVVGSKTGETQELLELCKKLVDKPCTVVGFIGDAQTPLDQYCDVIFRSIMTDVHIVLFAIFALQLIEEKNKKFKQLDQFLCDIEQFDEKIIAELDKHDSLMDHHVEQFHKAPFQLWVTSSNLWGEINCYCKYMLEEIQWLNAQPVHSLEFFHGPLEIIDENMFINVLVNRSDTRDEDLQVGNFAKRYTNHVEIHDMAQFDFGETCKFSQKIMDAYFANIYFDSLLSMHKKYTLKDSSSRRYYRKVEY